MKTGRELTMATGTLHYDHLVRAIFDGLLEPAPWSSFLKLFSHAMGLRGISLIFKPPSEDDRGGLLHICESKKWTERYAGYFYALDPLMNIPTGEITTLEGLLGREQLEQSEYFRGFMQPLNLVDVMALDDRDEHGGELSVRICRFSDESQFNEAQKELLLQIMPHLICSARIHAALVHGRSGQSVLARTLENLEVGAVVLDRSSQVIEVNRAALEMWTGKCAPEAGKPLRFGKRSLNIQLSDLVAAAISGDVNAGLIQGMRIPREDGTALGAVVAPFPQLSPFAGAQGGAILFLSDPHHIARIKPERLVTLFGLTMAEARVAQVLASGSTPEEAAGTLGVSINTVRKHVRSIYDKVGVSKQTDLIRVLMHSLATL
ncbi:MAG: helix-turn-helix transcriptional regulator [Halieaceae bacterium]|nr:helix-turn-helix transcriptional regulator [Halieaceae bacterium]